MNKYFISSIVLLLLVFNLVVVTNATEDGSKDSSSTGGAFVLCTKNRKTCTVGKKTISSTTSEPLYVEDGVVCTANKKKCTNGFKTLYTQTEIHYIPQQELYVLQTRDCVR